MKYILSFFLTLSVLCTSLSAVEYGVLELGQTESITLAAGDTLEPVAYTESQTVNKTAFAFTTPSGEVRFYRSAGNFKHIIVGPSNVYLLARNQNDSSSYDPSEYLFYKLTKASEVEFKQVNIVSLPSSTVGAGTHEIVVEASDDLQTWTPVHSSSIGGSKAFFRTRVVEAGE